MSKINVTQSSMPPFEEYVQEISDIWKSRWLTHTGPKHQQLAEKLCEKLHVEQISLFSNGHQALEAALSLLPSGSEVITTPFTFASTTLAIARCGLTPVFCDIEPEFYTIDPDKIEALITRKTAAIVPVHVYGNVCDWKKIDAIATKHHLKVIYDAAHAFGETQADENVANLGDISMFSFHATKVFHTIEGGCLVYHDAKQSEIFAAWRQFGMYDGETSEILGTNAKMTEFQAAMGLCNLRHLDEQIILRRKVVQRYRERFSGKNGLVFCREQPGVTSNYAYFPLRILPEQFGYNRDEIFNRLKKHDIHARKYFFPLTSEFKICEKLFNIHKTPIAKKLSEQILCLPLYSELSATDVDHICAIILG